MCISWKEVIKSLERIHFSVSEISIIEAKAKSLKIRVSRKRSGVNEKFNEGLSAISTDEKVLTRIYT